MTGKVWWCVEAKVPGRAMIFLGRVEASEEEIKRDLGPWIEIKGNHVVVFACPPPVRPT
jgi:hypothetical protein